jgi:hypothetical protein
MLALPLNDQAMKIVRAWHGMRKSQWVFYNPETGHQFKDLWLGLQKACKRDAKNPRCEAAGYK